jgi:hypothetical protein
LWGVRRLRLLLWWRQHLWLLLRQWLRLRGAMMHAGTATRSVLLCWQLCLWLLQLPIWLLLLLLPWWLRHNRLPKGGSRLLLPPDCHDCVH